MGQLPPTAFKNFNTLHGESWKRGDEMIWVTNFFLNQKKSGYKQIWSKKLRSKKIKIENIGSNKMLVKRILLKKDLAKKN